MNIDLMYAVRQMPRILSCAGVTLRLSFWAMFYTLLLALVIAIICYYRLPVLTTIANVYIDVFRGTPLITQLFFIYYGFVQISPFFRDMKAINAAAYTTENMRSALEAIPKDKRRPGLELA